MLFRQVGKEDRRAIGKLGNDAHVATHGFDRFSQRGEQQVAAFFKPGDAVLGDPESLGNAGLRKLAGLSEVAQAHFLGYEFSRTVLDLLSLGWAQLPNDFIHIHGHAMSPFQFGQDGRQTARRPSVSVHGRSVFRSHPICRPRQIKSPYAGDQMRRPLAIRHLPR